VQKTIYCQQEQAKEFETLKDGYICEQIQSFQKGLVPTESGDDEESKLTNLPDESQIETSKAGSSNYIIPETLRF
jgi:hypothetical protein